jgi:hypothetical protein
MTNNLKRTCLLVLGMHRSGTSALTRIISLLGAQLPQHLMGPLADNPRGFWESELLAQTHDRFLEDCKSCWDDWRELSLEAVNPEKLAQWREKIRAVLLQEFAAAESFVVKEPRICRFAPFFIDILDTMDISTRIVIPFRNPLEVAASLQRRNNFTLEQGIMLWLRHLLDAEAASQKLPRAFLSYDRLLTDWRGAMASISNRTGIQWSRDLEEAANDIESFIAPDLRHHAHEFSKETSEVAGPWASDVYFALKKLEHHPHDLEATQAIARCRREFEAASVFFSKTLISIEARLSSERQTSSEAKRLLEIERQAKEQLDQDLQNERTERKHFERKYASLLRKTDSSRWLLKKLLQKILRTPIEIIKRYRVSKRKRALQLNGRR